MSDYKQRAEQLLEPTQIGRLLYMPAPAAIAAGQGYAILALAAAVDRLADVLAPAVEYRVATKDPADG